MKMVHQDRMILVVGGVNLEVGGEGTIMGEILGEMVMEIIREMVIFSETPDGITLGILMKISVEWTREEMITEGWMIIRQPHLNRMSTEVVILGGDEIRVSRGKMSMKGTSGRLMEITRVEGSREKEGYHPLVVWDLGPDTLMGALMNTLKTEVSRGSCQVKGQENLIYHGTWTEKSPTRVTMSTVESTEADLPGGERLWVVAVVVCKVSII
jgi:hypothetical protein